MSVYETLTVNRELAIRAIKTRLNRVSDEELATLLFNLYNGWLYNFRVDRDHHREDDDVLRNLAELGYDEGEFT